MNESSNRQLIQQLLEECDKAESAEPLAIHRFVPSIAVDYGIPAALVFQHVHDRCERSGLKAVVATLRMLESFHPYLGQSALYHGLTTLVQGSKKCPVLLRREQSTVGYLYCPINPDLYDSQQQPHSFDVSIAIRVGVVPALVYNTAQRVSLNSQSVDPYSIERHRNWYWLVGVCQKHHVYTSENTIRRALKSLVRAGCLQEGRDGSRHLWSTVEISPALN